MRTINLYTTDLKLDCTIPEPNNNTYLIIHEGKFYVWSDYFNLWFEVTEKEIYRT